eukprot:TRINITY_DN66383_c14_g2_i1.p1 TRINITY_DN66383_c14_g2~~TRINITY_DN66383_c14_g2_i1.p1  ORF type:complete len:168 (+),score=36.95 TRINITY_DN66383_c14_g2_i1:124-627(+)
MGDNAALAEARRKMIEKRFNGDARGAATGGSGSARRKVKVEVKSVSDDKKLSSSLKKLNLQEIKGIEEVNMFREDDSVLHVTRPKVQANIPSNTFVISGQVAEKTIFELIPGIVSQLSPEQLQKLSQQMGQGQQQQRPDTIEEEDDEEEDDDAIPELVENFEEASKK